MAGVSTEQGSNGNKLEVDLNLVPFIDLLSTLVLFLLLTVVWIQIAAIPATNDGKGKSAVSETEQAKLIVTLTKGRFDLNWPTALKGKSLPKKAATLDELVKIVQNVLQTGATFPASVRGDDHVEYGEVIRTLDLLKEAGLTTIAMGTD